MCPALSGSTYDYAIVGLGPGGLSAAVEAAKTGRKVVAFTDRGGAEDYVRAMRISITQETMELLMSLQDGSEDTKDKQFLERLKMEKPATGKAKGGNFVATLQIKDMERYFYNKLQKYDNVNIVHVTKDNGIDSIDIKGKDKKLCIKDGAEYKFKNLIAADGGKRQISKLIQQGLPEKERSKLDYDRVDDPSKHQFNGAASLIIPKDQRNPPPAKVSLSDEEYRKQLKELGWTSDADPRVHVSGNAENSKFYVCGEIPEEIYNAKQNARTSEQKRQADQLIKKWSALAIAKEHGVPQDLLDYRESSKKSKKDMLRCCVFPSERSRCRSRAVTVGKQGEAFIQVGDAYESPFYHGGMGLNKAVNHGAEFVQKLEEIHARREGKVELLADSAQSPEMPPGLKLSAPKIPAKRFHGGLYQGQNQTGLSTASRRELAELKFFFKNADNLKNIPASHPAMGAVSRVVTNLILLEQSGDKASSKELAQLKTMFDRESAKPGNKNNEFLKHFKQFYNKKSSVPPKPTTPRV